MLLLIYLLSPSEVSFHLPGGDDTCIIPSLKGIITLQSRRFVIFIVNFEHISHLFLVFSLLIILAGNFLSSGIDRKKKEKENKIILIIKD